MKTISELGVEQLYWIQPSLKRSYELRAGNDLFAALIFETALGSVATAGSATDIWTFKRVGFFKPRGIARLQGSEDDLLTREKYHNPTSSTSTNFFPQAHACFCF